MLMSRPTDFEQLPQIFQTTPTKNRESFQNLKSFQNVKKKQETSESQYYQGNYTSFSYEEGLLTTSYQSRPQHPIGTHHTPQNSWNSQENHFFSSLLDEEAINSYNLFGMGAQKDQRVSPWTKSASNKSPSKEPTPFSSHYGFPSLFNTENDDSTDFMTSSFFSGSEKEEIMSSSGNYSYPPHNQNGHYFNPNAPSFVPKTFNEDGFLPNSYQEPSFMREELRVTIEKKTKPINKSKEKFDSQNGEQQYKMFVEKMKEFEAIEDIVEVAEEFFQFSPKVIHWKICLDIAEKYKKSNNVEQATIWYSHVNQMKPYHPQAWIDHAKIHEDAGNLEECQKLLTIGLSYCPYNENLLIRGIKFYEQRGNLMAARSFLSRLRQIPLEKSWKIMLEGALLEARAGNISISRKIFQYLMENVPLHGPIYFEAYKLEVNSDNLNTAFKIVQKGLSNLPKYGPLWFASFNLLEKLSNGDLSKLREEAERGVSFISKELIWKVYFELAQVEERAGNVENAREAFVNSSLYALPTLRWKVWMAGSRLELSVGNIEFAKVLLNRALEEVPNKTKAIILLECARLEEYIGDLEKAREFIKRAQKEAKHEWKVFLEAILLEMRAGETERAIEEAVEALKIHKRTGRLWAMLIQLKYIEGEDAQLKVFKEALNEVPKSGEVWCEGARIRMNPLYSKFDLVKAKKYLKFAINFTPQYGDSFIEYLKLQLLTKGPLTLQRLTKFEQKCVNADPNYGPLWYHCKLTPLDSTRQVLKRAKQLLLLNMSQNKCIFQQRIVESQSNGSIDNESIFEKKYPKEYFITGLPYLRIKSCSEKKTSSKKTQKLQKLRDNYDDEGLIEFDDEIEEETFKTKSGYIWQYKDGSFQNYDLEASETVEEVYQQWLKNPGDFDVRSVQSGQFGYMVDFRKLEQMNIVHENHTIRQIRRVAC
eukprot:gene1621-12746_t